MQHVLVKKTTRYKPPKENCWDSSLGRDIFGKNLSNIVLNCDTPLVISIEGSWGTGKSTFLDRWICHLNQQNVRVAFLDAWQASTFDNPRSALLGEILEVINRLALAKDLTASRLKSDFITLGKELLKSTLCSVSKGIIDSNVQQAVVNATKSDRPNIELDKDSTLSDDFCKYTATKKLYEDFRSKLSEVISLKESESEYTGPLVFIIDELDRCRPLFALDMLEALRHIFITENVVFVLSIDSKQIANSLQSIYGNGFDYNLYLRRIIDHRFSLPSPNTREFINYSIKHYNLQDCLSTIWGAYGITTFIATLEMVVDAFDLDMRSIEQFIATFYLCLSLTTDNQYCEILFFLVLLKFVKPEFLAIINAKHNIDPIIAFFESIHLSPELLKSKQYNQFKAYILRNSLELKPYRKKIAVLMQQEKDSRLSSTNRTLLSCLENLNMELPPDHKIFDDYFHILNITQAEFVVE